MKNRYAIQTLGGHGGTRTSRTNSLASAMDVANASVQNVCPTLTVQVWDSVEKEVIFKQAGSLSGNPK